MLLLHPYYNWSTHQTSYWQKLWVSLITSKVKYVYAMFVPWCICNANTQVGSINTLYSIINIKLNWYRRFSFQFHASILLKFISSFLTANFWILFRITTPLIEYGKVLKLNCDLACCIKVDIKAFFLYRPNLSFSKTRKVASRCVLHLAIDSSCPAQYHQTVTIRHDWSEGKFFTKVLKAR